MEKFATKIIKNATICRQDGGGSEDLQLGKCLQTHAFAIDGRDLSKLQRFFPVGVKYHMKTKVNPKFWYEYYQWFNGTRGSLDCCSDTIAAMHYIPPKEMNFLEFLIYNLHPFGLTKNLTESLPDKFTLKQIINAAEEESLSPMYKKHKITHNLDDNEIFKRRRK